MSDSWLFFWAAVIALLLVAMIIRDWKKRGSP
jgi:hypothetical protein